MTPVSVSDVPLDEQLALKLARAGAASVASRYKRDALIVECYKAGGGVREIARIVGLSHPAVLKIIEKAEESRGPTTTS